MDRSLTIAEAKSQTQAVEDQIVALVPSEYVAKVDQQPEGVLLACAVQDTVTWTGGTSVSLRGAPEIERILATIRSSFDTKHGYSTSMQKDGAGDSTLKITDASSGYWIVGPMKSGTVLDVASSSPCFPTPAGMKLSDRY